jgi:hypothetical protein
LLWGTSAAAQETPDVTYNDLGEVGLLDMPSARMAPDGQMAFTVGEIGGEQHYDFAFQRLPFFTADFRYTRSGQGAYDRSIGVKLRLLKEGPYVPDLSLGFCNILGTGIYDCQYLVASKRVGDFDLTGGLGWGRLAGNNVFANPFALVFPSFKTPQQVTPTSEYQGIANLGQFFHGPNVGVFGGAIWQTPLEDLKVIAEYSSDRYTVETQTARPVFRIRSPVNLGLSYHPFQSLGLTAGWFYGSTYGVTLNVTGDPTTTFSNAQRIGPDVPPPVIRSDTEQEAALKATYSSNASLAGVHAGGPWVRIPTETETAVTDLKQALYAESNGVRDIDILGTTLVIDAHQAGNAREQCARYAQIASLPGSRITNIAMSDLESNDGLVTFCEVKTQERKIAYAAPVDDGGKAPDLAQTIAFDLAKQDILLDALSYDKSELWLYYENGRYREESEAIGRITRVLMADAPPSVEIFHIVPSVGGVPSQEVTIIRSALERVIAAHETGAGASGAIALSAAPLSNPALDAAASSIFPRFTWSLDPRLGEHLFDPDKPIQFQIYADLNADVQLAPGLVLASELTGNIWNDLTFTRPPGSVLPHVRTDLLQYLKYGQYGISFLGPIYGTRLAPDVFAEAKLGYLEDMFMGGGGDILWRPEGSRFSFGADLYQVWQRDFNRLFGIQRYNILTGHITVYYESPWAGVNYAVHVGRYLAGDYGATFEITRRFASGVEIGAWATFTNVPFSKFGEGSFDKGIIIHIPFEWGLPVYSQASYDLHMPSLTRDGGQRLVNDDSLFEETRGTSNGEILQHLDDIVEP